MTTSFDTSPLGQRAVKIMQQHGHDPISLFALQKALRRQGHPVDLELLRSRLKDSTLITTLADDHYILREQFDPVPHTVEHTPTKSQIFLSHLLSAQETYVVLDIEASGLDAERDQMIQIAALRVLENKPVAFRSWYVHCEPEQLSLALRSKLHLTEEILSDIVAAPPLAELWPDVRAFLAETPVVIHNARFDTAFLLHHDPWLSNNVVDTMELALLVVPNAPRHNLSTLAEELDIVLEHISTDGIEGVPPGHRLSTDTLHNAITDVLLLDAVYRKLLQTWYELPPVLQEMYAALLPEAWDAPPQQAPSLATLMSEPVDADLASAPQYSDQNALALLDRFTAHADLTPRASQRAMVQIVADALAHDRSRLIEAPTGTGKTLGYLIPAVVAARTQHRRIALATAFKNLQDQLEQEVLRLQKVVPFNAATVKGTASYLCLRDLQHAIEEARDTESDRRYVLAFLAHWATSAASPTLDTLPYWIRSTFAVTTDIEQEVAVDRATCTEQHCPFYSRCHLFATYRRAEQADLVLINQALWLAEPRALPSFDALVIDEAHNLEDTATNAFRQEVSEVSLRNLLYQLYVPSTRRGVLHRLLNLKPSDDIRTMIHDVRRSITQCLHLLKEFRSTLATFVQQCDERQQPTEGAQLRLTGAPHRIHSTRWNVVQQALDQLWNNYVHDVVTKLQVIASNVPTEEDILRLTIEAVCTRLVEQEDLLQTILQARRADLVTWVEVKTEGDRPHWALCAAPISVASQLAERYQALKSVILTSATLTTGPRDFSFFLERLGLHGLLKAQDIHALDGDLPYRSNVFLGLPTYLTYTPAQTTEQSYIEEFADELKLLFTYTDGRALTLFTARKRLEAVWKRSASHLESQGIPVLAHHAQASRRQLTEDFREHGGAVLLGLKSFWEGVDVPGAALSFVVMEKLPYPALNDPVHAARREAVARQNGREFQEYLFPLMVIQFKQGFGRLVRRHDDRGAVIMYDKRVARKSYLPELLGALPGFQPRDLVAERSRRSFYELLATRFPDVIDRDAKADFLAELPEVLPTDLEKLVEQLALPDPLPEDEYATWRPRIIEAIKALYKHDGFRSPEQEAALLAMLTGKDAVAVLPTGAGKSLCFQLPALLRPGTTIVCSPLIALMRDQIEKLHDRGIEIVAALMSGQSAAEREEVLARVRAGNVRLLYLAPERLRDPVVLATLTAAPIRQIVVDEAHCVALWGPSFRPDFLVLPSVYHLLSQRPAVAAFTATATPTITNAIIEGLHLKQPVVVRAPIDRPELRLIVLDRQHRYHPVRSQNDQIRRLLLLVQTADSRGEAMLIYVATTKRAEELARLLQVAGYAARAYHGKMPTQERANVGELFMEGLINIVVCTKAFGMGIDKPDIRYVVHFNVPGDLESYAQEVGRAGRDGKLAYAVLLYHPSDERIQQYFIEQSRPDHELLANVWHWIRQQPEEWTLHPQAVCEYFDIDELQLKRAIFFLGSAGLIHRGPDVTVRGSLTLLDTWEAVLASVPAPLCRRLESLQTLLPMLAWTPQEIVLTDLAEIAGCTAPELEEALVALAVANGCVYRPWEKGYRITRLVSMTTALPAVDLDATSVQQEKLAQMRSFIHGRACRWQTVRRYFGEIAGTPCGKCDRCDPEQRYPWSGKTGRDVPDVSDFLDLATTILQVIDWNERQSRERTTPFGLNTLLRILRGDEYVLMRHRRPSAATEARRRALRSCPYWSVCRTLRRSMQHLEQLAARLRQEGYINLEQMGLNNGGSYPYPRLTERGQAQLLSGERLGWEANT